MNDSRLKRFPSSTQASGGEDLSMDRFQFGIEEEYFLAEQKTGETPAEDAADRFHRMASEMLKPASRELVKGQIEVQTAPSTDFGEARASLAAMRRTLADIAEREKLWLIAAGTQPLAESREQDLTEQDRYKKLQSEFGIIAQRALVCATHIHVEVPAPERRVELMNSFIPFLPLFYALSLSSPFWQGHNTGLKGFRLAAFAEWPRMGIPEIFTDQSQYEEFVKLLVDAGNIGDSSFIWWFIRPSTHYPTLELRICDSCPYLDDVIAIAALFQALMRALARRPELNANVGPIDRGVCAENIWQVQRRGLQAKLIDLSRKGIAVSLHEYLDAVLELTAEDAVDLNSVTYIAHCRTILERGTSAEHQVAVFEATLGVSSREDALRAVVHSIADATKKDL